MTDTLFLGNYRCGIEANQVVTEIHEPLTKRAPPRPGAPASAANPLVP